jgi:hypothetical protein
MATDQRGSMYTMKAASSIATSDTTDYTGKMYRAVYIDSAGRAALGTTATPSMGILQSNPRAVDEVCSVMTTGKSFYVVGTGGNTAGWALMADTDGSLIHATGTNPIVGVAMVTNSVGEIGEVLLDNKGPCLGQSAGLPMIQAVRIPLSKLLVTDGAVVTGIPVPAAGTLTGIHMVIEAPCSVAGKSGSLTVTSSAGAVSGGVLSLTSANCGQAGAVAAVASTAVSGGGTLATTTTLGLTWAHVTQFTAQDTGVIWVYFDTTA